LKILRLPSKRTVASLAWRNSPATLGLEMSEKPTSGQASPFPRSAAMTASDYHEPLGRSCAASKPLIMSGVIDRNKRLSAKKPLIMSGFPTSTTPKWVRFAFDRISKPLAMFSIRWALFRIFPFSPASIREWLCLEKCRRAGHPDSATNWAWNRNSGKLNKESE
jgi:hypothetical protein